MGIVNRAGGSHLNNTNHWCQQAIHYTDHRKQKSATLGKLSHTQSSWLMSARKCWQFETSNLQSVSHGRSKGVSHMKVALYSLARELLMWATSGFKKHLLRTAVLIFMLQYIWSHIELACSQATFLNTCRSRAYRLKILGGCSSNFSTGKFSIIAWEMSATICVNPQCLCMQHKSARDAQAWRVTITAQHVVFLLVTEYATCETSL